MPNLEWDAAMTLKSSYGVVHINTLSATQTDGKAWLYQVHNANDYSIIPQKFRPVVDSRSQADGASIQPPFIDGMLASMKIGYWVCPNGDIASREPACGEDLRLMDEFLMGVLNGLRTYPTDVSTQQYAWQPTGLPYVRLLEGVMLAAWPEPDFTDAGDKGGVLVYRKIAVASPYPYALDNHENIASIAAGTSKVVVNGGNSPQLPILFVHGASTGVAVVNNASGLTVSYDSTRPGALAIPGGHILQIDFAEGTCLLDGDPNQNYIAGLDPNATDLWPLLPNSPAAPGGAQSISVGAGANVDVISYWAWV